MVKVTHSNYNLHVPGPDRNEFCRAEGTTLADEVEAMNIHDIPYDRIII